MKKRMKYTVVHKAGVVLQFTAIKRTHANARRKRELRTGQRLSDVLQAMKGRHYTLFVVIA